jgi:transposase
MAQRKQWTAQEKLNIVLQGFREDVKISELCNDHGITQDMYYEWKNLLLTRGTRIFGRGGADHERERLEKENRKLKETIGELHVEQKKNDW